MGNYFTRKADRPRFKSMIGNMFSTPQTRKMRKEKRILRTILNDPFETTSVNYFKHRLQNIEENIEKAPKTLAFRTLKTLGLARGGKRYTRKKNH